MTIRRLVIAALLASAGAAHADTIPAQASSPKFVSGWTTGNGTDVLGSGVLQGNLNLIGGIAYTSGGGANVSLTDVLYGKVAGTVGEENGHTKLFFQRGIEANYLLASGHGILAATVGPGKSVIASADGAIIIDGVEYIAPTPSASDPIFGGFPGFPGGFGGGGVFGGGGSLGNGKPASGPGTGGSGGGSSNTGGGSYGGGGGGGGSSGGGFGGGSGSGGSGSYGGGSGGSGSYGGGAGGSGSFGGGSGGGSGSFGGGSGGTGLNGGTQPSASTPVGRVSPSALPAAAVPAAELPEPSSIALMLMGMMGAGAVARRRKQ